MQIFDAQVVDIGIIDREDGLLHYPYTIERGERFPDEPTPIRGFARHVIETREPLLINERLDERAAEFGSSVIQGENPKSVLFVPLVVGGEATGRISLQNIDSEHAFSESDVRLLTTLAGSLSVALENARLFEETRQRNAELALINDVQRGLAENLEMQAMYDLVGERIGEIFDAQTVDIGVVDEANRSIWFPYSLERGVRLIDHPIEIMGFRKIALETREPVVVNEDMERRCIEAGNPLAIAGEPSKSSVFVPLLVGNRGTGRDLAPQPGSRARVQRGRRPSAHDARREPERRARERAAVRGDAPARGRARDRERRRAGARGAARPRRADRAARRPAPRGLRGGPRVHRAPRSRRPT